MRALTTADEQLQTKRGGVMRRVRVSVKDGGGTFRDLTTYLGKDYVLAGSWGETVDTNGFEADFEVLRNDGKTNLSPYMTKSRANLGLAYPGTYAPLIDVGRELLIEWAIAPRNTPSSSLSWVKAMRGHIDSHDPTGGRVRFTAQGRFGAVQRAFIEEERIYAHADPADADATKGLRMYKEGDAYAVNELLIPGEAKRNAQFYKISAVTTGIGGAEGVWPVTALGTAVFGGVTVQQRGLTTIATGTDLEVVIQQIINDNMAAPPTINTPASPGWLLKWFKQARTGTWTAVRALVDQIGWDIRDVWHAGSSDLRFELRDPNRAKTTPDRTFGPGDHFGLQRLEKRLDGIRNVVKVWYYASADPDLAGNPKKKFVIREDAASIAKYGRLFMEVSEASTSTIDTQGEAEDFADAMLSDLAEPNAEQTCEFPFFPFVELTDLYRFTDDAKHYDANTDLAVVAYRHSFRAGTGSSTVRTSITCRGKPSTGYERWLLLDAGRNAEIHLVNLDAKYFTNVNTSVGGPGGAKAKTAENFAKHALPVGVDFHFSKTTGFTPSTSTLKQSGYGNQYTMDDGDPGDTYYGLTQPFMWNAQKKIIGASSAEFTVVPGFLRPKHVNPEEFSAVGDVPLNGSFEAYSRELGQSEPPDQWAMKTGDWLTDVRGGPLKSGAAAKEGARYLTWLATSVKTQVLSKYFQVIGSHVYELTAWVYRDTGDTDIHFIVEWNTDAKSPTSPLTITIDTGDLTSSAWNQIRQVVIAPADAAFCRIEIGRTAANNNKFHVDAVKLKWLGEPWLAVAASGGNQVPVFNNGWAQNGATTTAIRPENGRGWAKGTMGGGTVNATAIQLPNGLLPPHLVRCPVVDGAGAAQEIEISTGGALKLLAGNNTVVYLDHVSWPLS